MSEQKDQAKRLEVGTVYVRKGGPEKAVLSDGLQANRLEPDGRWSQVFGFTDGKSFSWLTREQRLYRLEHESRKGQIYSGSANLDVITSPELRQIGWMQVGNNWRQRNRLVFNGTEWVTQKIFDASCRQDRYRMVARAVPA